MLLDAKDWEKYPPSDADFWESGTLKDAQNQFVAANGTPIEWHFSTREGKNAVDELFAKHGTTYVNTVLTPKR